ARAAPEPAAYHGGMPDDLCWAVISDAVVVFALFWKAEIVSVVLTAPEERVTGFAENANWEATEVFAVAVRLIVPVNPLKGVSVRVTPEAALPDLADVAGWHGVSEKSASEVETTSTGNVPLEPVKVELPE